MRFSGSMAVLVLAGSVFATGVSSSAQTTNGTFRVKHSAPEKAPKKSAPIGGKTANVATSSGSASKDLQSLEHQTAKTTGSSRSASKKTAGGASGLKPVKDKPNPPINFGGQGGNKSVGMSNQGSNPYHGRLRQKHAHQ
jgi:hypothetical protein